MAYGGYEVIDFFISEYSRQLKNRMPIVHVPYAEVTGINLSSDRSDIRGGRGYQRLMSFDHSKEVTINATLPLIDLKVLGLISGDDVEKKIRTIYKRESGVIRATNEDGTEGEFELKYAPAKDIGGAVHVYDVTGCSEPAKMCEATTPGAEYISDAYYTIEGKTIKFKLREQEDETEETPETPEGGCPQEEKERTLAGREVAVYYHTETEEEVTTLRINANTFPKTCGFYGEVFLRDDCTERDELFSIQAPKVRVRPESELSLGGTDGAVLELTIDVYAEHDPATNEHYYIDFIRDEINDIIKELEGCDPCDITPTKPEEKPEEKPEVPEKPEETEIKKKR